MPTARGTQVSLAPPSDDVARQSELDKKKALEDKKKDLQDKAQQSALDIVRKQTDVQKAALKSQSDNRKAGVPSDLQQLAQDPGIADAGIANAGGQLAGGAQAAAPMGGQPAPPQPVPAPTAEPEVAPIEEEPNPLSDFAAMFKDPEKEARVKELQGLIRGQQEQAFQRNADLRGKIEQLETEGAGVKPFLQFVDDWTGTTKLAKGYRGKREKINELRGLEQLSNKRQNDLMKLEVGLHAKSAGNLSSLMKLQYTQQGINSRFVQRESTKLSRKYSDLLVKGEKSVLERAGKISSSMSSIMGAINTGRFRDITRVVIQMARNIGDSRGVVTEPDAERFFPREFGITYAKWKTYVGDPNAKLPPETVENIRQYMQRSKALAKERLTNYITDLGNTSKGEYWYNKGGPPLQDSLKNMLGTASKRVQAMFPEIQDVQGQAQRAALGQVMTTQQGGAADPKIQQYADQYGINYGKAEDILKKRGYGQR